MLSEKSQLQKVTYCMISYSMYGWNDKIIEMENRLVGVKDPKGKREVGVTGLSSYAMKPSEGF